MAILEEPPERLETPLEPPPESKLKDFRSRGPIDPEMVFHGWDPKLFEIRKPEDLGRTLNLEHGWLFDGLVRLDITTNQRWLYHVYVGMNEWALPPEPIPYLHFDHVMAPRQAQTCKMLEASLNSITRHGEYRGWSTQTYFEYFCDWLLFAFGDRSQPELPREPVGCEGASDRLFQVFNLGPVLLYPADYFGYLFAETAMGRGSGFYPTPMSVAQMIADMNAREDDRLSTFCELAIGTGSIALAASNHVLSIYGQDINDLVLKACKVQGYWYAPWMVRPIKWIRDAIELKRKWELMFSLLSDDGKPARIERTSVTPETDEQHPPEPGLTLSPRLKRLAKTGQTLMDI